MDDWLKSRIGLLLVNAGNKDEKKREGKWTEIIEKNDKYYRRTKWNVEGVAELVYGVCYNSDEKAKMTNGCKWKEQKT